jgi:hypothetical protein
VESPVPAWRFADKPAESAFGLLVLKIQLLLNGRIISTHNTINRNRWES